MMRYTRWIVLGIGGLVATATGVGALTGTSPTRTIVNLVAVVDELGNLLFGSKPGKVEVTNFPSQPGAGKIFDAEPVTEWAQVSAFDTAERCERARLEGLQRADAAAEKKPTAAEMHPKTVTGITIPPPTPAQDRAMRELAWTLALLKSLRPR